MAARMLTVVCAWCNRTMTAAATGAPVTHSICPPCLEWSIAHPTQIVHHLPSESLGDFYSRDGALTRRG